MLFGDGAGAAIVMPSDEPGIISCALGADGQYRELLHYPAGVSKDLPAAGTEDANIIMKGNEVFKVAVKTLGAIAEEALDAAGHWGVPTMVFEGEPFFGQDRLDVFVWRLRRHGLEPRR